MHEQLTKEECKAIQDISKGKLNGLYKKLIKECNVLYITKQSIQKSVMESVRLTLGKLDTTEARVHNLKVMRKYLSMISSCITRVGR